MHQNIAKTIGKGWRPTGKTAEMLELSDRIQRLGDALKVAEKWMESSGESSEMWSWAEVRRDEIEEELSRACFEMAVENHLRILEKVYEDQSEATEERKGPRRFSDEQLPEVARLQALEGALMAAYCDLREAPSEEAGGPSRRGRYEHMGAIMVAWDSVSVEMERLEPSSAEAKRSA